MAILLAPQEVEIGEIEVSGQSGQKVKRYPNLVNKTDKVVHICGPSYTGSIGRRNTVQCPPQAKSI
jgi:hypothetical protein